jgi:hypothetical protein
MESANAVDGRARSPERRLSFLLQNATPVSAKHPGLLTKPERLIQVFLTYAVRKRFPLTRSEDEDGS